MTRDQVLAAFDRMRVRQQGDRQAVHTPLLVLLALARIGPLTEFETIVQTVSLDQ